MPSRSVSTVGAPSTSSEMPSPSVSRHTPMGRRCRRDPRHVGAPASVRPASVRTTLASRTSMTSGGWFAAHDSSSAAGMNCSRRRIGASFAKEIRVPDRLSIVRRPIPASAARWGSRDHPGDQLQRARLTARGAAFAVGARASPAARRSRDGRRGGHGHDRDADTEPPPVVDRHAERWAAGAALMPMSGAVGGPEGAAGGRRARAARRRRVAGPRRGARPWATTRGARRPAAGSGAGPLPRGGIVGDGGSGRRGDARTSLKERSAGAVGHVHHRDPRAAGAREVLGRGCAPARARRSLAVASPYRSNSSPLRGRDLGDLAGRLRGVSSLSVGEALRARRSGPCRRRRG